MQVSAAVSEAAAPSEKVDSPDMWDAVAEDIYKFQSAGSGAQAEVEVPTDHEEEDDLEAGWRDPGPARSDEEKSASSD